MATSTYREIADELRAPVRLSVARYVEVLAGPGERGPWETACAQQGIPGRTEIVTVD